MAEEVVHIEGLEELFMGLDQMEEGLDDFTPFLKPAGMVLVASSQKNFQEGGRPKWAPLSPVTLLLRAKSKSGYRQHKRGPSKGRITRRTFEKYIAGAKTLRDTDILMASIGNSGKGGVQRLTKTSITVGTALEKAEYLQDGVKSTKGWIVGKKIPARPFMVAQDEDKRNIHDLGIKFVELRKKEARL